MSSRPVLGLAVVLAFLLGAALAAGDTLVMKNGSRLQGTITAETADQVQLRMAGGAMWIPRRRIARIDRDGAPASEPVETTPPKPAPEADTDDGPPADAISMFRAVASGRIRIAAHGDGLETLVVDVTPTGAGPTLIHVPAGVTLRPRNREGLPPAPDLMVRSTGIFRVESTRILVRVPVSSLRHGARVPDGEDAYEFTRDGPGADLARLAPLLRRVTPVIAQAAVWIVTDDLDYEGLGSIGRSFTDPGTGETFTLRAVDPEAMARATRLVDLCGVPLDGRKIRADRAILVAALSLPSPRKADPALTEWARSRLSSFGTNREAIIVGILASRSGEVGIREACRVAAALRIRAAIPELKRLISSTPEGSSLRTAAADALASLATGAIESGEASGGTGGDGGVAELVAMLARREHTARSRALRALTEISERITGEEDRRRLASAILATLRPGAGPFGEDLSAAVAAYHDAIDESTLLHATTSSDRVVRLAAIGLLAHVRSPRTTARVVTLLRERDPKACLAALRAAGSHPGSWHAIAALCGHADVEVRVGAVAALAGLEPDGPVLSALVQALRDEIVEVRAAAAQTLGSPKFLSTRKAVPDLRTRLLSDPSDLVRVKCAHALAGILKAEAVPDIRRALGRATDDREKEALEICIRWANSLE